MAELFYHDYTFKLYKKKIFKKQKEHKALTYHPAKNPLTMLGLHQLFTKKALRDSEISASQIKDKLDEVKKFHER